MKIRYEFDPDAAEPFRWHAFSDYGINETIIGYGSTKGEARKQFNRKIGAPEEEEQDETSP